MGGPCRSDAGNGLIHSIDTCHISQTSRDQGIWINVISRTCSARHCTFISIPFIGHSDTFFKAYLRLPAAGQQPAHIKQFPGCAVRFGGVPYDPALKTGDRVRALRDVANIINIYQDNDLPDKPDLMPPILSTISWRMLYKALVSSDNEGKVS